MRTLLCAAALAFSAPAGAASFTNSGTIFAEAGSSSLFEIDLGAWHPLVNRTYTFSVDFSRPAEWVHFSAISSVRWWIIINDPGGYFEYIWDLTWPFEIASGTNVSGVRGNYIPSVYEERLSGDRHGYYTWTLDYNRTHSLEVITQFALSGPVDYVARITGPIPEPESWVLMIAGFGAVGGALRHRRAESRKFSTL